MPPTCGLLYSVKDLYFQALIIIPSICSKRRGTIGYHIKLSFLRMNLQLRQEGGGVLH